MSETTGSSRRTWIHAQDRDFILYTQQRGEFTVLAPAGRYTEALLGRLAEDFLAKSIPLAVDLSKLDAVTLPLVKALCDHAAEGGRVVLLRPPEKILALVRLVGRQDLVPVVLSEGDLEGDPESFEARAEKSRQRFGLVREMLQSNPCWQLVDPDQHWLCPFCVTFRPDVTYEAVGTPSRQALERISRHLGEECSTYADGATDGWPFEVLERVAAQAVADRARQEAAAAGPPGAGALGEVDQRRRLLLPTAPASIPNCDTEICYRGAPEPSGDFYDFVRLPERRVALVVGDVSARNVEPGVLMGMARKTISIRLRDTGDPGKALEAANEDLVGELEEECLVTAAVAVIDGPKREVRLARAGHVAPFLVRAATGEVERLVPDGPVLGLVPTSALDTGVEVETRVLEPGDLLFLHTDGLEGLRNPEGELFGADRIAGILRTNAGLEAAFVLGAVIVEAEQFAGPWERKEDLTAVCVRAV